jgi:predicted O-methyltransferase YrrM
MPKFTKDYFGARAKEWQKYTASLVGKPNLAFLEVGTFEGRTAIWLLDNVLTHPTSHITIIDVFKITWESWADQKLVDDAFKLFTENIKPYEDKVTFYKKYSITALKKLLWLNEKFDFIYIDGSHKASDVLQDGVLAWQLLKPGGIIVFDDYKWGADKPKHHRPQLAIDSFLAIYKDDLTVLHQDWQVFVRKNVHG